MTPRQQLFVLEYLIDLNGTAAARRAGYAPNCARAHSWHLLRRPDIAAAIRTEMEARALRTGVTRERVLAEYARLAFADLRPLANWNDKGLRFAEAATLPRDVATSIIAIAGTGRHGRRIRIRSVDRLKALDGLARILGLRAARATTRQEKRT